MRNWTAYGRVHSTPEEDGSPRVTSIYENESAMRMCGYKKGDYNKLDIVEDPDGLYLGWLHNSEPERITMIQHDKVFNIQFPYGYKREEEHGNGIAVRVRIEVIDN